MPNIKRSTIFNFATGYANIIFTFISSFVLVPLYFRYFDLTTYGSWLASGNVISMMALVESGLSMVAVQCLSNEWNKPDRANYTSVHGAIVVIAISITTIYLLINFWLAPFIPSWVKCKPEDYAILVLAIKIVGLSTASTFLMVPSHAFITSLHKLELFSIFNVVGSVCGLVANFVCLQWLQLGLLSIAIGYVVKSTIITIASTLYMILLYRQEGIGRLTFSFIISKIVLGKMINVLFARFFGTVTNNSQEFLVTNLINPATAAIVSITSRLFSIISMAVMPAYHALYPVLASFFENNNQKYKATVSMMKDLMLPFTIVCCAAGIILNQAFITTWLGAEKYGGIELTCIIAFSTFVNILYQSDLFVINSMGKFFWLTVYTFIDAVTRILLLLLLFFKILPVYIWSVSVVELISVLVISILAHINYVRLIANDKQITWRDFNFFSDVVMLFSIALVVHTLFTIEVNSWTGLVLVAIPVFSLLILIVFLSPKGRLAILQLKQLYLMRPFQK